MRRGVTFADCGEEAGRVTPKASRNSTCEFETKSPDHAAIVDSPVPMQETPDYIRRGTERNLVSPVDLFGERNVDGLESHRGGEQAGLKSSLGDASLGDGNDVDASEALAASFELGTMSGGSLFSINAGDADESVICGSVYFQKDGLYSGGESVRTHATVEHGNGLALYQSARVGNVSYKFQDLEAGDYLVDLHFAEIVFTEGPQGVRVFDIFIQDKKVVSLLDIYARVGSNQPLILSDLRALVVGKEGLLIRFEGVVGEPIVSAIAIRYDTAPGRILRNQFLGELVLDPGKDETMTTEEVKCGDCEKLKRDYQLLLKEQCECRKAVEDLKKENESKSRECQDALSSLHELQMELMRKSMHVGSLAFAVEGQVKEKTRWFQSLAELSNKFQMMKLKYTKLSEEALAFRKCSEDISQMSAAVQSNMDHYSNLEKEYRDLKFKFGNEVKERKDLYNKVIELRGNIRVFCRCRPLNVEELVAGASMVVDFESAKDGELIVKGHVSSRKVFKFDSVFSPEENQDVVFEKTAPLATSVLDGFNVCIFAYGQTGTGKTFTMEGTEEARGVNYRTLEELFRIIKEREGLFRYEVTVSGLEVYNEQIRDLLVSGAQPGASAKRLEVRQVAEGVHHVPGLVEAPVNNTSEAWEVLQTGSKARVIGSTCANEHSSRSHCIHCVMVKGENLVNGECTRSKLWLIDLAGSERVAKTDAQGERLKEAQSINKSLSALGDVISALATKSTHVPFRNSKLTHLLQDSLGGDSKVLMFVQISPNENDVGETLCSLNFASRVRGVELGPAKRQVDMSEIFRYKQMVGKIKEDGKQKEAQIKRMEETIYSLETKNKAKELINKNLQDKIKELESQLLVERKLARQHVDTKIAEHQLHQKQQQQKDVNDNASMARITNPISEEIHTLEEEEELIPFKELMNVMQPPADGNSARTKQNFTNDYSSIIKHFPLILDKENKPELAAEESLPRRPSRVSLCPTTRQVPLAPALRRNSLIPLPTMKAAASRPMLMHITENPSSPIQLPQNIDACEVEIRTQPRNPRKISSILRRNLQKKVIIRPQLPQTARRGSTLAGLDKMRVSLGGSARKARRVVAGNGPNSDRMPHRQHNKEKERGWNHGTAVRNIL